MPPAAFSAIRLDALEVLAPAAPVVAISVVHPKPGRLDTFLAVQEAYQRRLRGQVAGLRGSRSLRAGDVVVLILTFDDAAHVMEFARDPRRLAHLEHIQPLVERMQADVFEEVYASGVL